MEYEEIAAALAGRFRAYRELARLTQKEAAAKIEISSTYLSSIETGGNTPTVARMVRMAEVYGCTVADFWMDVDAALREGRGEPPHFVDRSITINKQMGELASAVAYLIDLAHQDRRRLEDEQLLTNVLTQIRNRQEKAHKEG